MSETTESPAFDLSAFEVAEIAVLELNDAAGQPLLHAGKPVRVHLYGPGSQTYVRITAKLEAAAQTRTYAALRGAKTRDTTAEQRADLVTKLTACTQSIENFPIDGGPRAIYENPRLGYITTQVQRFLDDWANFPPQSAQS